MEVLTCKSPLDLNFERLLHRLDDVFKKREEGRVKCLLAYIYVNFHGK